MFVIGLRQHPFSPAQLCKVYDMLHNNVSEMEVVFLRVKFYLGTIFRHDFIKVPAKSLCMLRRCPFRRELRRGL